MKVFLKLYFPFCLLMGFVLYALYSQFGERIIHPYTGYTFGFFVLLTLALYWMMHRFISASKDNFMASYFAAMTARLLLSLSLVLVYLLRGGRYEGSGRWAFLGSFFVLYFLFAGFEIWAVLSNLRPFSKRGEITE